MASSIVKIIVCIYLLDVACGARFESVSVLTVATDNTHGLQRLQRSAKVYGFSVEVLGLNEKWTGGDMNLPGGGQKIKLLKNKLYELQKTKSGDHIVIFTDGYDVIFLDGVETIIERFKEMDDTKVLFSAEPFCWPDWSLAKSYPTTAHNSPYLNSGLFMGYLNELYQLVSNKPIKDTDDDQLYYTMAFIDENIRSKLKISLDYKSRIFQNLQGLTSDIELNLNESVEWPYIVNKLTNEKPLVVHGNGMTKLTLNNYGNYLAKAWSPKHGCNMCQEKKITLDEHKLPNVFLSIFIEQPTPFIEEFFNSVKALDYPKSKINLLIRNNVPYHEEMVAKFVADNGQEYSVVKRIKPEDQMTEAESRKVAMDRCVNGACDYFFSLDSVARVKPSTLKYLLSSGYDVISPMLLRPGHAWSNFWGAINVNGFYARSHDYMDIVGSNIIGIWNVPFITHVYLVKSNILRHPEAKTISFYKQDTDPDMVFCASLRDLGVFMHVSNEENFGHLVNPESFDPSRTHPDMYQVIDNKLDWEARYLNEDFHKNFEEGRNHSMPCPDVYWFPVMNLRFCKDWIEIMEAFGGWSDGTHSDNRLEGGYEAVPTRDIHMTQVGLDTEWLHILKEYVRPLQEMVFLGYYHNPPRSLMNFVVRYRPDEQPSLRPHHDSSTYTINLALNTAKVDYEGGGCRFIRYNCSVRDTKPGWLLMHPGRLTHFHEGLLVTKGTRYIMISFVDP